MQVTNERRFDLIFVDRYLFIHSNCVKVKKRNEKQHIEIKYIKLLRLMNYSFLSLIIFKRNLNWYDHDRERSKLAQTICNIFHSNRFPLTINKNHTQQNIMRSFVFFLRPRVIWSKKFKTIINQLWDSNQLLPKYRFLVFLERGLHYVPVRLAPYFVVATASSVIETSTVACKMTPRYHVPRNTLKIRKYGCG